MWFLVLILVTSVTLFEKYVELVPKRKTADSERRINANSMVGNISGSLVKECKLLCENKIRINCVKSHSKSKKKEGNTKLKKELC